jgi:hemerythrin-like domain-containing protein
MLLQPTPAPSFDDPLAMLRACHGRIQAQCATLRKLQAHLPTHGCDTQVQQAAQAVLRYFDTAGQHHHEDEEHDLFPRLRATGNAKATALITRLLAEHETMTAAWQRLRPQLLALAEARTATLDAEIVEGFIAAYTTLFRSAATVIRCVARNPKSFQTSGFPIPESAFGAVPMSVVATAQPP